MREALSTIAIGRRPLAWAMAALLAGSCLATAARAFDIDISVIQADPAANPSGYRVMLKALSPAAQDTAPQTPGS